MGKKLTTEEFIQACSKVHNNKYTYELLDYKGSAHPVEITCPQHGPFWQKALVHKDLKAGCSACARASTVASRKITQEDFIARATAAHPSYDFSNTVYKGSNDYVSFGCPVHGVVDVVADRLLKGTACPCCSRDSMASKSRLTQEEFLAKAAEVHGDKFEYSRVRYTNRKAKIEIVCKEHGSFFPSADNHLGGAGCPKCQKRGFNLGKPAYMYILVSDNITKVGITNRKPTVRSAEVSKRSGRDFKVHTVFYFVDGSIPLRMENACHKYLNSKYKRLPESFDGSTECFLDVDIQDLLNFIVPIAANPESEQSDHKS